MNWSDVTSLMTPGPGSTAIGTLIVGAGPAALSVLHEASLHPGSVLRPICLIADAPLHRLGAGRLADYFVTSDTAGSVFLEVADVDGTALSPAGRVTAQNLLKACSTSDPVPRPTAAEVLALGAGQLVDRLLTADNCVVISGSVSRVWPAKGGFLTRVESADKSLELHARHVVLAVGGRPWTPPRLEALVDSASTLIHSDALLRRQSLPKDFGRVTIVGGAHSAFATATDLLANDPDHRLHEGAVRLVHRAPVRMTYSDVATAVADGAAVSEHDVCLISKRVHRFAGLRGESARLWQRARDGQERRVELVCAHNFETTARYCRGVDLAVAATGYVKAAIDLLPGLFELDGDQRDRKPHPRIDRFGKFIQSTGQPVDGLYCVGLGAGHRRVAGSGGEASFEGSVDGVWYYQKIVAPAVIASITSPRTADSYTTAGMQTRS